MEKIKRLDDVILANGHKYKKIIRRSDGMYAYEQYDKEDGSLVAVEVFKARVRPKEVFNGVEYPKREVFPKDSDFGVTAFSLRASSGVGDIITRMDLLAEDIYKRNKRKSDEN